MNKKLLLMLPFFLSFDAFADVSRLVESYPEMIRVVTEDVVIWQDGTEMLIDENHLPKSPQEKLDTPSLLDQLQDVNYVPGFSNWTFPKDDPGRIRYEPFFKKMYGNTEEEVKTKLVQIYWMPKLYGSAYPLLVTTVNHVHEKFIAVSNELEALVFSHPEYAPFLSDPGGTFEWRYIANTTRLSNHSFGMTIDINPVLSNYWQWDLIEQGEVVSETAPLVYRNTVPLEIVEVFEKYGFIWGGKWYHYDSMHFEYRPEVFKATTSTT